MNFVTKQAYACEHENVERQVSSPRTWPLPHIMIKDFAYNHTRYGFDDIIII